MGVSGTRRYVTYVRGLARRTRIVTAIALLGMFTSNAADARLQSATPKGVDLRGHWTLDAARSDDAQAVRETVRKALERERAFMRGSMRASERDSRRAPPISRPDGGLESEGPGAVGEKQADESDERARNVSRWLRENEGFLASFGNPVAVDFEQSSASFRIRAGENDTTCTPGETVAVTDRRGTTERSCGWEGRAFVLRFKPKERGAQRREDRYELDAATQRLVWTTSWTKGDLPDLRLRREYVRR